MAQTKRKMITGAIAGSLAALIAAGGGTLAYLYGQTRNVENDFKDNIFITKSYDAQIHFEDDMEDVFEIYEKITGQKLELDTDI